MANVREFSCINCKGNHRANFKSCEKFIENKKINILIAENNLSAAEAKIAIKKGTAPVRRNNVWTNEWPSIQESLGMRNREDSIRNKQERIEDEKENQEMWDKENYERRNYQFGNRRPTIASKELVQRKEGRHKEEKEETKKYYQQFNNRETEIRKKNWGLGLRRESNENNLEDNKPNAKGKIEESSKKELLEKIFNFIAYKIKEIKERGKRGSKVQVKYHKKKLTTKVK